MKIIEEIHIFVGLIDALEKAIFDAVQHCINTGDNIADTYLSITPMQDEEGFIVRIMYIEQSILATPNCDVPLLGLMTNRKRSMGDIDFIPDAKAFRKLAEGYCTMTPYNIPFFIRTKYNKYNHGARIYDILEAIAHGRYSEEISENDRNYACHVVLMVEGPGYDCRVPKRQVVRALERAFRKSCRIKFEPKPETMDRYDGWEYTAVPDPKNPIKNTEF